MPQTCQYLAIQPTPMFSKMQTVAPFDGDDDMDDDIDNTLWNQMA